MTAHNPERASEPRPIKLHVEDEIWVQANIGQSLSQSAGFAMHYQAEQVEALAREYTWHGPTPRPTLSVVGRGTYNLRYAYQGRLLVVETPLLGPAIVHRMDAARSQHASQVLAWRGFDAHLRWLCEGPQ